MVEVEHLRLSEARAAWTGPVEDHGSLGTVRTWGTLVGAKAWLAGPRRRRGT
ncbi:MAG: hypothetical protein L3K10_01635 [Thermoplasmata archaeon]|nr:hypothetical protein [Thermoplasmata archaeon]